MESIFFRLLKGGDGEAALCYHSVSARPTS